MNADDEIVAVEDEAKAEDVTGAEGVVVEEVAGPKANG